jgi:UDP-N-acetylmuramate dehydrogenase
VKLSAAWLIERSGLTRGYGEGPVGLSTRHTLAIVNRGGATARQVVRFARGVRDRVRDRFGVELRPEPVFVNVALDDAGS